MRRVSIRHASNDEMGSVRRCLESAFEPYRSEYTPEAFQDTVPTAEAAERRFREMTVLVAVDERGAIVGTVAHVVTAPGEGHVRGMAVDPRVQGQGIAARLLGAAERELAERGCSRVTLDTTAPLQRAIGFYERRGYQATGMVSDFFGMPLIEYEKHLSGQANTDAGSPHGGTHMDKVNISDKLARFTEQWKPKIVGELNGQLVKLVKFQGPFVWHKHDVEDEMFLVVAGGFRMELRDRVIDLEPGEFLIVPRGVEHRPVAEREAHVMLFEPASTLNTGDVRNERTVERLERL